MPETYIPPRRFAGIDKKVNRFFVAALAGIVGVILLVSYKQGLFIPHTPLHFYAPDALGINNGTTVRLFGLQIGTVRNMQISDRGVKVELGIVTAYIPRIPKGSHVKLARESYVGGASLQIIPPTGGGASQPVAADDEIAFVTGRTIVEIIDDIKGQVTPLVADMRGMLADFNRPDGDYRRSTAAARELLEQLPATNRQAQQLLRDTDHTVRSADAAFSSVSRVSAQAEQQLPVLTGKITTTLDTFAGTAAQIGEATRKNSDALHETLRQTPALVRDADALVTDGQEIVGAVRNAWPVRNLVEPRATRTLPVDSFEAVAVRDDPATAAQR